MTILNKTVKDEVNNINVLGLNFLGSWSSKYNNIDQPAVLCDSGPCR